MCIDMKLNHPESIRGQCLRNDGISTECMVICVILYVPIDHLYSLVISTGKGALLVKADIKLIKGVYRILSIHSED